MMITGMRNPEVSNTSKAQGGIVMHGEGDSPDLLAEDIQTAGAGICNPLAVRQLAEKGPELVQELLIDDLHVPFTKTDSGEYSRTEEGAHSVPRILHAADLTGKAIIQTLHEAVRREKNIDLRSGMLAVDLINIPDHGANRLDQYKQTSCAGAYVLDTDSGEVISIIARETILATGGLGQIFLHTTNPVNARGDGIAMAYRIGARLLNLEYVQFHPTALFHRDANRFLISESMRGEGAVLIDHEGNAFMERYHPQGSLAPRDVVARAIHNEMLESDEPCVYLDITSKPADWVRNRFPHIYKTCLQYGVDITSQPIPVVPAAHYSCGGIYVDLVGQTTIPHLRAAGEVACTGLHGANRLASTSLLEGLLWGWNTGEDVARNIRNNGANGKIPPIRPFQPETDPVDKALIYQDWRTIKRTMWNYVGLVRTPRRLSRAMSILRELQQEILSFYRTAVPSNPIIGLRNGITTSLAVLFAVQRNQVSLGCHYITED